MRNVVVLGSGMAGMGATYRLSADGLRPLLFEQHAHYGGHTMSFRNEQGFLFDLGPHISFTKDERIQKLLAGNVDQQYESIQVRLNNYWRGYWPTHPVQLHMHGLPQDLIVDIIDDFVAEQRGPDRTIRNYEDWLLASYGRKFAEQFPMQYTRKYHLTEARNMSTDWLGPRMYRPNLKEMLRGALSPEGPNVEHYVSNFRYPKSGGFVSYLHRFAKCADVKLEHKLIGVDPRQRTLQFAHGATAG